MLEPAFLPLLPILSLPTSTYTSFLSLSQPTTISGLRSGFIPFPLPPPPVWKSKRQQNEDESARQRKRRRATRGPTGEVGVVVREMMRGDVEAVEGLHLSTLPIRYSPIFYTHLLTSSDHISLLSFSPSSPSLPTGCITARSIPPPNTYHSDLSTLYITSLSVSKSSRRQGIAKKLVAELVRIRGGGGRVMVGLHVQVGNEGARNLYGELGLEVMGVRGGYYMSLRGEEGGGDAVEMIGILGGGI